LIGVYEIPRLDSKENLQKPEEATCEIEVGHVGNPSNGAGSDDFRETTQRPLQSQVTIPFPDPDLSPRSLCSSGRFGCGFAAPGPSVPFVVKNVSGTSLDSLAASSPVLKIV
jgi:hypothetical protein